MRAAPSRYEPDTSRAFAAAARERSHETLVVPGHDGLVATVRDVWRSRRLVGVLARRDITLRYKQTAIGLLWAVLQPLLNVAIFYVIFGRLVGVPTDGMPYPVFALTAIVPWSFFTHAATVSTFAVLRDHELIKQSYFPRAIVPVASVSAGLVDFLIAFALLVPVALLHGIMPSASVWTLVIFVPLLVALAMAVGLWLSALHAEYRDVAHLLPYATQLLFFLTPVAYPSSLVPEAWRPVVALNPMATVVDGFRWALLDGPAVSATSLAISTAVVAALFVGGALYFARKETEFADIL